MDDDRSRLDSLGISNRNLDRKSRRLFWICGGLATVLFLSGILYTIFFYITLPSRRDLKRSGEKGIEKVPMPVPPTTLFPQSTGSGQTVVSVDTDRFTAAVSRIRGTKAGFDVLLTMTFKGEGRSGDGVSLILSGPPRWVDGKQEASRGAMEWNRKRRFMKGEILRVPIHFSVFPRTLNFDIYVSFTGSREAAGKRYFIHFSDLKLERPGG